MKRLLLVLFLGLTGLGCNSEKPPEPTPENMQKEIQKLDEMRQKEASNS